MGRLNLADSATIYLDSAIFIYTLQSDERYFSILNPLWEKFQSQTIQIVTSELSLMEILVQPFQRSDVTKIDGYERFLSESSIQLIPINRQILKQAAQLRSIRKLKTPDAIHASTSIYYGCTMFLTNDRGFQNTPRLPVIILDQLIQS